MGFFFPPKLPAAESTSTAPTRTLVGSTSLVPLTTPGGLDPQNNIPTLGKMQAGSFAMGWVAVIEGCKYVLSDKPAASVLAAGYGPDFTEVLGGLFVELQNTQSISPDDPFPTGGRCILRVLDETGSDTFGIYVNKRSSGDKTTITETLDRNDTTLNVARGSDFTAPSDVYIGTECVGISAVGASTLTATTRGKYAALGCDSTGSGGARFGTGSGSSSRSTCTRGTRSPSNSTSSPRPSWSTPVASSALRTTPGR
jgi:hypothetical protein